jgi:putative flippase GtrA
VPPVTEGQFGTGRRVLGPLRADHIRFGIIGVYNTGFSFGVFAGLTLAFPKLTYFVVLLVSHVLGVLNAYVAYRYFVFHVKGHWFRDLFRFWLVYLGGLGANLVALPLLVEVAGLPVLMAQGCVVLVAAFISWFGHKHVSFRRPTEELALDVACPQP